jgi:hypothetical protein
VLEDKAIEPCTKDEDYNLDIKVITSVEWNSTSFRTSTASLLTHFVLQRVTCYFTVAKQVKLLKEVAFIKEAC